MFSEADIKTEGGIEHEQDEPKDQRIEQIESGDHRSADAQHQRGRRLLITGPFHFRVFFDGPDPPDQAQDASRDGGQQKDDAENGAERDQRTGDEKGDRATGRGDQAKGVPEKQ